MSNSCHKNPENAQYYFKCKVDGQEYIPNGCANCLVAKLLGDTTLLINGNRGFEAVDIGIIKLDRIPIIATNYILNDNPQQNGMYDNSPQVNDIFKSDATRTGLLNITVLDKSNKIISGIFYFQAYNPVQNKTVNITDGQFRLNYSIN